jgi:anion-transporting  ArsA/GET3 family ATPase
VGKTTLAAAMALQYAIAGYRTVVLTVDPARRLAQALGFTDFTKDLQAVPLPDGAKGSLQASMLDSQRYFDRVIERFATSPAQKERVLSNPLYRAMVDGMGGTHEYAAMERLFEFSQDSSFEKIIVDTPPTQNAIDLLSAPARMADFMDNSVLKWFRASPRYSLSFFRQGTRLAMK